VALRVAPFSCQGWLCFLPGAPLLTLLAYLVPKSRGRPGHRKDAIREHRGVEPREADHLAGDRCRRRPAAGTPSAGPGHGLALVPATAAAYYQRPDITYRPVTGAQPYQVALATTADTAQRPEAQAFVKAALAMTAGDAADPGRVQR
jgi:hypothetical protein